MKKVSIVTSRTELCGQAITFVIFQEENFQVLNEQSLFSYLYLKPVRSRGSQVFLGGRQRNISREKRHLKTFLSAQFFLEFGLVQTDFRN